MRYAIHLLFALFAANGALAQPAMTRPQAEEKVRELMGVQCEQMPRGETVIDYKNASLKTRAASVVKYQKAGILDVASAEGTAVNLADVTYANAMAGAIVRAEPAASAPKDWYCDINGEKGLNLGTRTLTEIVGIDKVQKRISGKPVDFYLVQATVQYSQSDIARKFYGYSLLREQKMQALYAWDVDEKKWRLTRVQVVGVKDEFVDIVKD